MDSRLKQRLIGAAVLVALGVIFLPMLVQGPAPDSGVSDVPLSMPDTPSGDYQTRDLPLVTPGNMPDGGAVGMDSSPPSTPPSDTLPTVDTATSSSQAVGLGADASTASKPLPPPDTAPGEMFPAPTAGGDYAVSFGAYATSAAADNVVGALRASQLPGYREATTSNGKSAWRVRIGPYASRADAEAARLRAAHVRDDVGARVVALDAQPAVPATPARTPVAAAVKPAEVVKPAATKAPEPPATNPLPASTPVEPVAAADTGLAVQLAAFSKPADAATLRDKLRSGGFNAFVESVNTDKGVLTRVRVGPVATRAQADQLNAQIKARTGMVGIVRPHP